MAKPRLPGLKPLDRITEADERQRHFCQPDTLEPVTLASHHHDVGAISLGPAAPDEIVELFDRARNAFLYAWFVYELGSVAEMQAWATLELALRKRLDVPDGRSPGLRKLAKDAIEQGLVVDPQAHLEGGLPYFIATLRNTWDHGSANLHDPNITLRVLQLCADLINQLYPLP